MVWNYGCSESLDQIMLIEDRVMAGHSGNYLSKEKNTNTSLPLLQEQVVW